jgi:hypothetical protein
VAQAARRRDSRSRGKRNLLINPPKAKRSFAAKSFSSFASFLLCTQRRKEERATG